jgi:hypothetical protein
VVLGTLLPLAELAIAGALIAGPTASWGALAALIVLLLFCVAIAWNLSHGRAPDCHCFGQLHSSPASRRTVARNLGLAALGFLLAAGLGALAPAAAIAGVGIAALVAGLLPAWLGQRVADSTAGDAAGPPAGLPVGTPAPDFRLPGLTGGSHTLDSLRADGRPLLLLFSDPNCGPCIEMAPEVARRQRQHSDGLKIAVIERRDGPDRSGPDAHGRENVLFQRDSEVADAYRAHGTPTAVLVGADGAIASPVAGGAAEIEALVARNVDGLEPLQPSVVRRNREPGGIGLPFIRRELLVRGAGAWAATTAFLASPLRAAAGTPGRGQHATNLRRCDHNRDCGPGQTCRNTPQGKRCRCTDDPFLPDECGKDCTNFDIDTERCGGCGTECICGRSACAHGDCVRGEGRDCNPQCGEICCDGKRVHPAGSQKHCGGCNRPCNRGKSPECCGGYCVDTDASPRHCGACYGVARMGTRPCKRNEVCFGGRCRDQCPPGTRRCGDTSASRTCYHPRTEECCGGRVIAKEDMQFDEKNCGACGSTCPAESRYQCCPKGGKGACVNTLTDGEHCSGCGQFCSGLPGAPDDRGCECDNGQCVPRPIYAREGCTTCPCI